MEPTRNENGLMTYARLEDCNDATVVVQRCRNSDPRVVVAVVTSKVMNSGPPELNVEQAKIIRDALDTFIRRAAVVTDAFPEPTGLAAEDAALSADGYRRGYRGGGGSN